MISLAFLCTERLWVLRPTAAGCDDDGDGDGDDDDDDKWRGNVEERI